MSDTPVTNEDAMAELVDMCFAAWRSFTNVMDMTLTGLNALEQDERQRVFDSLPLNFRMALLAHTGHTPD